MGRALRQLESMLATASGGEAYLTWYKNPMTLAQLDAARELASTFQGDTPEITLGMMKGAFRTIEFMERNDAPTEPGTFGRTPGVRYGVIPVVKKETVSNGK